MADYKVTDTELTSIANAIRTKGSTSVQLEFPTEFVSAINAIPTGGGSGDILTGSTAPIASLGNNGDIYRRVMPLAAGVDFVEYLRSSGSQYIDTGIYATQDTDVDALVDYAGTDISVFGARSGSATDSNKELHCVVYSNGTRFTKSGKAISQNTYRLTGLSRPYKVKSKTIKAGSGKAYTLLSNESVNAIADNSGDFTSDYHQLLFGAMLSGTVDKGSTTIYRITYFEAGSPIADYIPCIDGNGVACMWDNIAGEYVYNDGTGDFTYGSAATPTPLDDVYYLKVNGAWVVSEIGSISGGSGRILAQEQIANFIGLGYCFISREGGFYSDNTKTSNLGYFEVTPGTYIAFAKIPVGTIFRVQFFKDKTFDYFEPYISTFDSPKRLLLSATTVIAGNSNPTGLDKPGDHIAFFTLDSAGVVIVDTGYNSTFVDIVLAKLTIDRS